MAAAALREWGRDGLERGDSSIQSVCAALTWELVAEPRQKQLLGALCGPTTSIHHCNNILTPDLTHHLLHPTYLPTSYPPRSPGGLGNRLSRQLLGCVWRCLCIQCRCRAELSGLPVHVPAHSCLPVPRACTSSTSVQVAQTRRHRSLPPPAARAAAAQSNDDAAFLKTTSAEVAAKLGLTSAPAYALDRFTELFGFEAVPAAGHAAFEGERHCSPWVCRCPVLACE